MTVREIADLLDADFEGDGNLEITSANALERASQQEIAFVEGDQAEKSAAASQAGCLLVSESVARLDGRNLIRVAQPRSAFVRVLKVFHPPERPAPGVHSTAVVADSVSLGEGVAVGPYAVLEANVRIGANSVIGAGVTIGRGARIGEDCHIHSGAIVYREVTIGDRVILHSGSIIGSDGFGYVMEGERYEKFPQIGTVEIGNDVEVGANACIDRGALGATIIGEGTKLDNMVHIGHNCRIGKHVVIAAQTGISGGCVVEDYVVMGGQVGISEKAHIGAKAVIGAQCGILPHRKIPAGQTVWGTPSRPHREHLRKLALVDRLPKVIEELKSLRQKVDESEREE